MTVRPSWCKQCHREPVDHGNVVCSNCAIRILKTTCTHPWHPELIILRASNGYEHPRLRCRRCYSTLGAPKLRDINPANADGLIATPITESCARCGRKDAIEIHHWAPRHLFPDAENWPTSPLCPTCHRTWHVTTGTAGTAQPKPRRLQPVAGLSPDEQPVARAHEDATWAWSPDLPF